MMFAYDMGNSISNNTARHRYELEEEGQVAFADYRLEGNMLYIKHVESPTELRGKGTAGRLMEGIANESRTQGYKIIPICGYAAAWLKRHDEYKDIQQG